MICALYILWYAKRHLCWVKVTLNSQGMYHAGIVRLVSDYFVRKSKPP